MVTIPLPSRIHYELLLQLLEQQTLPALSQTSPHHEQVQQVIINLRKALAQQKQLEASCTQARLLIDYRWSLSHADAMEMPAEDLLHQGDAKK